MPDALTPETMSPGLLKVVERARTEPEGYAFTQTWDV